MGITAPIPAFLVARKGPTTRNKKLKTEKKVSDFKQKKKPEGKESKRLNWQFEL